MKTNLIRVSDSAGYLKYRIPDNTFTACITDPPYGISFMGKAWDTFNPDNVKNSGFKKQKENHSTGRKEAYEAGRYNRSLSANQMFQYWVESWAREVLRTLKPGGVLISFCGSRTFHRMVSGIEDAGFQIRDCLFYMYGSGFPKSHNIALGIDKNLGLQDNRSVGFAHGTDLGNMPKGLAGMEYKDFKSSKAKEWAGYGTALKPAYEPIIVAMKPLDGSFADNALKWGVAGLNIDAGRIPNNDRSEYGVYAQDKNKSVSCYGDRKLTTYQPDDQGRWPSNIIIDPYTAGLLDAQAEEQVSRFFYCAKASREEREAGLEDFCRLDSLELIVYANSEVTKCEKITENAALKVKLLVATDMLQKKAIVEYGTLKKNDLDLSMLSFGKKKTVKFLKDIAFVIRTKTSLITESKTFNLLARSNTKEYIQVVNLLMENGSSRVENVEKLNIFQNIIKEKMALALGVNPAVLRMQLKINVRERACSHPTVKPIDIMRYLIKLVKMPADNHILDLFMGSGSTGCACALEGIEEFTGLDKTKEYIPIAQARIDHWSKVAEQGSDYKEKEETGQTEFNF